MNDQEFQQAKILSVALGVSMEEMHAIHVMTNGVSKEVVTVASEGMMQIAVNLYEEANKGHLSKDDLVVVKKFVLFMKELKDEEANELTSKLLQKHLK